MKEFNRLFYFITGLCLFLLGGPLFADTVHIGPNTIISTPTSYRNVTLDLSHGSFIITNNAILSIENSEIQGTLSPDNPVLFSVQKGKISLTNNVVTISTQNLPQHPMDQSMQYVIQTAFGQVTLQDNSFTIDNPFTAGFLITSANFATDNFQILRNKFEKFHGVLYLVSTNSALVKDNTFVKNTYGHIVNIGNNNSIIHNMIYFSGNNRLGNALDIINSNHTSIRRNEIYTPTCHAIYLINSHDVEINKNRIVGGITYAINLLADPEGVAKIDDYLKAFVVNKDKKSFISSDIKVTKNYMAQNRFGLAATDIDNLTVTDNIFIQRFHSDVARQFWTNNNILFKNVTNLVWMNNVYKEAYTQDINGSNTNADMIIPFPQTGGIHF